MLELRSDPRSERFNVKILIALLVVLFNTNCIKAVSCQHQKIGF